ncbi:hypothetical protein CRUP_026705, partial [Coryphaenoides rupestris]
RRWGEENQGGGGEENQGGGGEENQGGGGEGRRRTREEVRGGAALGPRQRSQENQGEEESWGGRGLQPTTMYLFLDGESHLEVELSRITSMQVLTEESSPGGSQDPQQLRVEAADDRKGASAWLAAMHKTIFLIPPLLIRDQEEQEEQEEEEEQEQEQQEDVETPRSVQDLLTSTDDGRFGFHWERRDTGGAAEEERLEGLQEIRWSRISEVLGVTRVLLLQTRSSLPLETACVGEARSRLCGTAVTMRTCQTCGSTSIDVDQSRGSAVCMGCGAVLEDNIIVSEVEFGDRGGSAHAMGQFVAGDILGSGHRVPPLGFKRSIPAETFSLLCSDFCSFRSKVPIWIWD